MQTREELQASLLEYQEQLQTVITLLADDPENEEYKELRATLEEMTEMTKDLLRDEDTGDAGRNDGAEKRGTDDGTGAGTVPSMSAGRNAAARDIYGTGTSTLGEGGREEEAPRPVRVSRNDWNVGDVCEARFSGDGLWYKAVVLGVIHDPMVGHPGTSGAVGYEVKFSDYGNREDVSAEDVRDPVIVKVGELLEKVNECPSDIRGVTHCRLCDEEQRRPVLSLSPPP